MDMEMDLVSTCKTKLAYFRIKELKEVLGQLGLSKQGKKQDLMDRILGLISDEEVLIARGSVKRNIGKEGVANVIDDAYRKMRISEGAELSTKGQGGSDICSAKPKTDVEDPSTAVVKIFCLCGSSLPTESMIKCVDPSCQVQQHISCVVIPEKPMEGIPPVPPLYFCEICRIKRADPFWVTWENILPPVKLIASKVPTDGTNPLQNVERTFQLSKANRELLQTTEYDVQAWCILLNDKVSFRMQWPQYADLQVNGIQVRTVNRPGSQLLGANGRDDGALITLYLGEGVNKISLSGCDSRIFCFGVRLVKRRTVEQVLNLIPKEMDGKPFEDALARVRRCIGGGGGMATVNEDSDSDLEVIADSITVNLRCPMSGSRMKVAGRFKPCVHMGCFDLDTFVEINQRSRKWQCPICLKNYSLEDIIIDPYFNRITTMMRHCGEDITEIEVKPDGSWTAKTKGELSDLAQWHFPDGSICMAANEVTSDLETLRQIKKEDDSQGHTNSGRNQNLGGIVEVSKHQHINLSSRNSMEGNFENYDKKIITMSSSASISDRDDEEPSINQDFYGHIDISTDNGNETNSTTHNFDPTFGIENRSSAATVDPEVIILSDSEEENVNMVPHEPIYQACPVNGGGSSLSAPPGIHDSYLEDPALDGGVNSCLGLFNGNGNDIGMSNWQYASGSRAGSGFQLFGTDSDVSDAFIDLEHSPVTYSGPINGYTPASKSTINSGGQVLDSSVFHSNMEIDDGLVDNPLAFVSGDHLQNFLPTQPAGVSAQSDLGHHPPISNGRNSEDWVSLRLGSNGESAGRNVGPHSHSVAGRNVGPQSVESNGLDLRNGGGSNKAALLTEMNDEARSNSTKSRKMSDGPFSFPRQPRSVRQRVFLSIDSD